MPFRVSDVRKVFMKYLKDINIYIFDYVSKIYTICDIYSREFDINNFFFNWIKKII